MTDHLALRDLFESLQDELASSLRTSRSVMSHPTNKGRASEISWLDMLQTHLPNRYNADSGRVVDSNGHLSDAIDIIVFDGQYSPLLFKRDGTCYVPAESVYAVFEVKQELDKGHIEYAGDKAASVRRLKRTTAPIPHAGGEFDPKEPQHILGGILALEDSWSSDFSDRLTGALEGLEEEQHLDLGIALSSGAFETGTDQDDALEVTTSQADVSLVSFFLGLIQALQRLGTVPAIDIAEYAQALQKDSQ